MTRRSSPTPDDLDREPQLAVLSALEATLDVTTMALIAAHPELREATTEPDEDATAAIARACVLVARDLEDLLATYRRSLERPPHTPIHLGGGVF